MSGHHDAHADSEQMGGQTADPAAGSTVFVGVVGTLIVVAIVIALEAVWYVAQRGEDVVKRENQAYTPRVELERAQQGWLEEYGQDAETGAVKIPIDVAMEATVRELQSKQ